MGVPLFHKHGDPPFMEPAHICNDMEVSSNRGVPPIRSKLNSFSIKTYGFGDPKKPYLHLFKDISEAIGNDHQIKIHHFIGCYKPPIYMAYIIALLMLCKFPSSF